MENSLQFSFTLNETYESPANELPEGSSESVHNHQTLLFGGGRWDGLSSAHPLLVMASDAT